MTIDFNEYEDELIQLRRHFHAYPELSLKEYETSAFVKRYLEDLGLKPEPVGETGLTALVRAGDSAEKKTAAVRAEMDAVAVEEKNDFPWKSRNKGVMHACGHDGIIATALVLAKLCVQNREDLPLNVKFLFQPAEENGAGTHIMLDGGAMENPYVDYFIMFHYANDAAIGADLQKTPASAVIGSVDLQIDGISSHWGAHMLGRDSILAAGKVLAAADEINQTYDSPYPVILGFGTIRGGTARNVLAGQTVMQGTLRACRMEDYFNIREIFEKKLETIQKECGVSITAEIEEHPIPPIISDSRLVDIGLAVGEKMPGFDCRLKDDHYLSGDSASYYFEHAKGIFAVFTGEKEGIRKFSLHSGDFDYDEGVMVRGLEFLFRLIMALENDETYTVTSDVY